MARERHAPEAVRVAGVLAGLAMVLGAIVLSLLAAWMLVSASGGTLKAAAAPRPRFPAPALEATPRIDRLAYERSEQRKISQYGWVDREKGIVRIPVESAMQLLSQRSNPTTDTRP